MSEIHELLRGKTAKDVNGKDIDLYERVKQIKGKAEVWLDGYKKNGFDHSERLERYLDDLTKKPREDKRFNYGEAFILLCAVYMHDLGYMLDGKLNPVEHPDRSQKMIEDNFNDYLLGDFPQKEGKTPRVAEAIGQVCVGHSEDQYFPLENLDRFKEFADQALCNETMDLKKITAFLRIADEADDPYIRLLGTDTTDEIRGMTKLVDIGTETIKWYWANDGRGDYEEYKNHIDNKSEILRSSVKYIHSLDLCKWYMVLEGGDKDYIPDPFERYQIHRCFKIPHRRNPNFTGKEEQLAELHQILSDEKTACVVQAIVGLGGVGKTQVAAEYCFRHEEEYKVIWWLESEDKATLETGFLELSNDLGIKLEEGTPIDDVVSAVFLHLDQMGKWLLVFDNVPHQEDLIVYLPPKQAGHIIVTSRDRAWKALGILLELDVMKSDEAIYFLEKRTGIEDKERASKLAEELGYLPLALEQAGAYIESSSSNYSDYLRLFNEYRTELFEAVKPLDYNETVTTTWNISFQKVREESQEGVDLLNLFAFFAPNDIPLEIIRKDNNKLPEHLKVIISDELKLNEALLSLIKYSLVDRVDEFISVHRLVQEVTIDNLSADEKLTWATVALMIISDFFTFQHHNYDTWKLSVFMLPHAIYFLNRNESIGLSNHVEASLLKRVGSYFQFILFDLNNARYCFEKALNIDNNIYGSNNPIIATRVSDLGLVLQELGDLDAAEEQFRKALMIGEKANGQNHNEIATWNNNLGSVLRDKGDLDGAKIHFQKAVSIEEAVSGPDSPRIAPWLNNLGLVLCELGDLDAAEERIRRALSICKKSQAPENDTIAYCLSCLGRVLHDKNDKTGAKNCHKESLEILENLYGPDHPETISEAANLGGVLHELGDVDGAKECYERVLSIIEKPYCPDRPSMSLSLTNVGFGFWQLGDLDSAEKCCRRALAMGKKVFKSDHPIIAATLNTLGLVHKDKRDFKHAKEYFMQSLSIGENVYGFDSPEVATIVNNLGLVLENLGETKKAAEYFERSKRIREKRK